MWWSKDTLVWEWPVAKPRHAQACSKAPLWPRLAHLSLWWPCPRLLRLRWRWNWVPQSPSPRSSGPERHNTEFFTHILNKQCCVMYVCVCSLHECIFQMPWMQKKCLTHKLHISFSLRHTEDINDNNCDTSGPVEHTYMLMHHMLRSTLTPLCF